MSKNKELLLEIGIVSDKPLICD